jgi:hypothetical protein
MFQRETRKPRLRLLSPLSVATAAAAKRIPQRTAAPVLPRPLSPRKATPWR